MKPNRLDRLRRGWELQARDTVVVSHPRCGTTWCQMIVLSLLYRGCPGSVRDPMNEAPWIEASICRGKKSIEELMSLTGGGHGPRKERCFKTHAPSHLAPWCRAEAGARLLLVTRDPRDAAVSHFHHLLQSHAYKFTGDWESFYELFLNGRVEGGDFWAWHEGWFERAVAAKGAERCLWVHYEDLIADLQGQVKRIATFLGLLDGLDDALTDEELASVATAAEFHAMKDMYNRRNAVKMAKGLKFNPQHLRRGEAGSWPEVMSEAQSQEFCARCLASPAAALWQPRGDGGISQC